MEKYADVFKENINRSTLCKVVEHKINTGNHQPLKQYTTKIPVAFKEKLDNKKNRLLSNGIIKRLISEWCSRIVPLIKPDDTIRLCIDFRHINEISEKETYSPLE